MTEDRQKLSFSFFNFVDDFEDHIHKSIRGYADLRRDCVRLSRYFIENNSSVIDIGCSTGKFLGDVRAYNGDRAPAARCPGMDIENAFERHWKEFQFPNMKFQTCDVRTFTDYNSLSFVTSLFSLQFIPERDRREVMVRIFQNMIDGEALILAEKTLSESSRIQDMLTFIYYDFKKEHFSEEEILDKEKSLRDKLKPWTEAKTAELLKEVGFSDRNIQVFWRNHLFAGILAIKNVSY